MTRASFTPRLAVPALAALGATAVAALLAYSAQADTSGGDEMAFKRSLLVDLARGGVGPGALRLPRRLLEPAASPPDPAIESEAKAGASSGAGDAAPASETAAAGEGVLESGRPGPVEPKTAAVAPSAPASAGVVAAQVGPGEPAGALTLREEPLREPLLPIERWDELLLAFTVNGKAVSDGTLVAREPLTGRLAVPLEDAQAWRLAIDPDVVLNLQGLPFVPLDAIEGASLQVDDAALSAVLEAPPAAFVPYAFDASGTDGRVDPEAGYGAFLDYDVVTSFGEGADGRVEGLAEAGLFTPQGVLTSSFRGAGDGDEADFTRLETSFARDFPSSHASLLLGDGITLGGTFGSSSRFGGVSWSTDFALDPGFVSFPLPSIGGLAERESVVDLVIDNVSRATNTVPPGPFEIRNLPVVTGRGELQVEVTDLLGRERLITQPYYVSPALLRPGLQEFAHVAGFKREGYGRESFGYGAPFVDLTHRLGLTNGLSGEVHAEADPDRGGVALGGVAGLGNWGVLSGGVGASYDGGEGSGGLAQAAYEFNSLPFSLSLRSRYTDESYRTVAGGESQSGSVRRTDQASVGVGLGRFGRLGLLAVNRVLRESEDSASLSASYSVPVGKGSLLLTAAQEFDKDDDAAVSATFSLPLGTTRLVTAGLDNRLGKPRASARYRQRRGRTPLGPDWQLAVAKAEGEEPEIEADVDWQFSNVGASAAVDRRGGETAARVGLSGSLAYLNGGLRASRRLGRAFALIDLPQAPNVRVFVDNREVGRTDANGELLLPNLRPYEENRVSLAVEDMPLSTQLAVAELATAPRARSGVVLNWPVASAQASLAVFVDAQGQPLPAGTVLVADDGGVTALVGKDGFAQIDGPQDRTVTLLSDRGASCSLPGLVEIDAQTDRGRVVCR